MTHPILTNAMVRTFNPCYDPIKWYSDDAEYTALDILRREGIPAIRVPDQPWTALPTLPLEA